jgi:hypothetical protein
MPKPKSKRLSNDEIIAFVEKPKSMRYIRRVVKPIFEKAQSKFGDAIVKIVEREHWGPNFDAYYDIWVRRRGPEVKEFISHNLHQLQDDKYLFVLAQIKETADYSDYPQINARSNSASKNGKLARVN